MSATPKVSVCMPAYNAGKYIGKALRSVLQQTFREFELIVIDDGSTDDTASVLQRYQQSDQRIRAYRNDRKRGLVFTRNRCLTLCAAPLVAVADADDISLPTRLEKQVAFLESYGDVGVLGADVVFVDEAEMPIETPTTFHVEDRHIRFYLMFGPAMHNCASVYRRSLLRDVSGYSDGFDAGAEDYSLWGKLMPQTRYANLAEPLVLYRRHAGNTTANRPPIHANIMSVSAALLTDYLGEAVDRRGAEQLHCFRMKMGMERQACAAAFGIVRKVWRTAKRREAPDTLGLFGREIADAAWTQAQYTLHSDRALSRAMASFAVRRDASTAGSGAVLSYLCRGLLPDALRRRLKETRTPATAGQPPEGQSDVEVEPRPDAPRW